MAEEAGLFAILWVAPRQIDALAAVVKNVLEALYQKDGTPTYAAQGETAGIAVHELYRNADTQRQHGASDIAKTLHQSFPHLLDSAPERLLLKPLADAKSLVRRA